MIHHYPLQWPVGWPHFKGLRKPGGFQVDYNQAIRDLGIQLEALGATAAYISTDQQLRVDGQPRRNMSVESTGVAVYFVRSGKSLCVPCDRFDSIRGNVRAIGLTLEAVRRMERYGTSQMVEAALAGFTALPAQASANVGPRAWHEVLGVDPNAPAYIVRAAYRATAAKVHPDAPGGSDEAFIELNRAYKESGADE